MPHIQNECSNRFIDCTNGCGSKIRADLDGMHKAEKCELQTVTCDKCKKEIKHRNMLDKHKKIECSGLLKNCPDCEADYKIHGGVFHLCT